MVIVVGLQMLLAFLVIWSKMKYKTLDDVDVKGKVIFIRADLNSEIIKGKPSMNDRIREHARTIKELVRKKAKVVVLSYQGRKGNRNFSSLREHAKLMSKIVKTKFVADVCGDLAKREINNMQDGEAILLENMRFEDSESDSSKKSKIVKNLGNLADIFVSDAFSVVHRKRVR
jgi:phosphoglycerate kinase